MNSKDVYKIWCRAADIWSPWVRPIPFVSSNEANPPPLIKKQFFASSFCNRLPDDFAIIVDLPSDEGVMAALCFAEYGYRPVPLYNGCNAQFQTMSIVDNSQISAALFELAPTLMRMEIKGKMPVFLVDSNRMQRHRINVSVFDNSWDLYAQDMPSASFLQKNGVKNIMVYGSSLNKDIKLILKSYKKAGIKAHYTKT